MSVPVYEGSCASLPLSSLPQLLLTPSAPSVTASPMAVVRLLALEACTTRMLQSGHAALTIWTSSAVSPAQLLSFAGSVPVPVWLTMPMH